jgi:hypothetical protein
MAVIPMLGDWEVPRIARISTAQARKLAAFAVPGRQGSAFQDLGADAAVIEIAGSVFSDQERQEFLDSVQEKFDTGAPMTFVADITSATDIQYVLIEALVVEEHGTRPGELSYHLRLRESPPPPPPADPFGAIDTGLLDAAAGLVGAVSSALDALDALGDIPDFSDPSALLGGVTDEALAAVDRISEIGGTLQSLFGSG